MDRDVLRPGWPCIQFQRLELNGEIPKVVLDSSETECWIFHVTFCVVCVIAMNE